MPLPYDKPVTLLQRLDNLGHHTLRFFRHHRRAALALLHEKTRASQELLTTARLTLLAIPPLLKLARRLTGLRASPSSPRFYLIDPSFRENFGLYDTLARRLRSECAARGCVFIHLTGHFDRPSADRIRLFCHAAQLPTRVPPQLVRSPHHWRTLRRADKRVLRHFSLRLGAAFALDRWFRPDGDSYFYFPTGDLLYPYALLDKFRPGSRQHIVSMHFKAPYDHEHPRELRRLVRQSRLLGHRLRHSRPSSARVRLSTDVPALQRLLSPALGSSCQLLYFPLLDPLELDTLPISADLTARPYTWGYFGYASPKHGWPVIYRLLQNAPAFASRGFISINPRFAQPEMVEEVKTATTAAGATLHFGYWADGEYAVALARCAALLFPYDRQHYVMVSSGKLIDGLRHGCFPVVPADTWLAEAVQEVDYGLVVRDQDWSDVPRQLATLDFPALWAARRERVRHYLEQFTARAVLDTLLRPPA